MSWLKLIAEKVRNYGDKVHNLPDNLWARCDGCETLIFSKKLEENLNVCPSCSYHMRLPARARLLQFLDEGTTSELGSEIKSADWLHFTDSIPYTDRIEKAKKSSHEEEALIVMRGYLRKKAVIACAFDFSFMGGSMGTAVGERFAIACREALDSKIPLICFSSSGGARMQEGILSLMQMAKTSANIKRLKNEGIPYISVLTNPTYGGVSASLAMLGDINLAEPGAFFGFAGKRVIEQTIKKTLPDDFQNSEFAQKHGAVDLIVSRKDLPEKISLILSILD